MIEERAQVMQVGVDCAWVEINRQAACGECKASCGTAVLARFMAKRQRRIRVLNSLSLQVGDEVVIGLAEQALLQGATAVYLLPLLCLFLGAGLAELIHSGAEGLRVLLGMLGLTVGLLWLRSYSGRIQDDERFQPVVLRRASTQIFSSSDALTS